MIEQDAHGASEMQYVVLYTKHKTRKNKVWQDGFLRMGRNSCTLMDEEKRSLETMHGRNALVQPGAELELEQHLVTVEGLAGCAMVLAPTEEPKQARNPGAPRTLKRPRLCSQPRQAAAGTFRPVVAQPKTKPRADSAAVPADMPCSVGRSGNQILQLFVQQDETPVPNRSCPPSQAQTPGNGQPSRPQLPSFRAVTPRLPDAHRPVNLPGPRRVAVQHVNGCRLRFPAATETGDLTQVRATVVPQQFQSLKQYVDTWKAAIEEQISMLLARASRAYHQTMDMLDTDQLARGGGAARLGPIAGHPLCDHGVPARVCAVRKDNQNKGRQFYSCGNPQGGPCGMFKWLEEQTTGRRVVGTWADLEHTMLRNGLRLYANCQLDTRAPKGVPHREAATAGQQPRMWLTLSRKDKGSTYSKHDLWVLSDNPAFSGPVLIAHSVFYGPTSSGQVELELLAGPRPSSMPLVFALQVDNVATELACLAALDRLRPTLPVLPFMLQGASQQPLAQLGCRPGPRRVLQVSLEERFDTAEELIMQHGLNADQAHALRRCAELIPVADSTHSPVPVLLVHGVFGAGKSFLLATMALLVARLQQLHRQRTGEGGPGVLVSSATNVAVDNILLGLLGLGCTDFVRVGSLKKIATTILPYSVHSSTSSHELQDLKDMLKSDTLTAAEEQSVRMALDSLMKSNTKARLNEVSIVGATCAASVFPCLKDISFPIVILDECSQITEPAACVPIVQAGCQTLILAGDPKQLPPTVSGSEGEGQQGLEFTLFERLAVGGIEPVLLHTQYRCHPLISGLCSALFYDSQLRDGVAEADRPALVAGLPALCFLDAWRGAEMQVPGSGSLKNELEAATVARLVRWLLELGMEASSIGIVTLYRAQADCIQQKLGPSTGILLSTVDAFQGGEKDIILFSLVRTNPQTGFADSPRRINVALSRARRHLLVVGHYKCLAQNTLWQKVIATCKEVPGGLQDAEDFPPPHLHMAASVPATPSRTDQAPDFDLGASEDSLADHGDDMLGQQWD